MSFWPRIGFDPLSLKVDTIELRNMTVARLLNEL
jgi:hypothetical protein